MASTSAPRSTAVTGKIKTAASTLYSDNQSLIAVSSPLVLPFSFLTSWKYFWCFCESNLLPIFGFEREVKCFDDASQAVPGAFASKFQGGCLVGILGLRFDFGSSVLEIQWNTFALKSYLNAS